MRRGIAILLAGLVLAVATASCNRSDAAKNEPPVLWLNKDDAAMNAAVAQARSTLPKFQKLFEARPADVQQFLVKVAMPTPQGGREHLWMVLQDWKDGSVSGVLINEPEAVPSLHDGDRITAKLEAISDWSYAKHDKFYGQYTTRVMLSREPAADAAEISSTLWPQPLEPGRP